MGLTPSTTLRSRVIVWIQHQYVSFVVGVYCIAHHTNLAVQTLSNLPLVSHIEILLQCLYGYFNHILKMHLEFTKWARIMEIKGNKFLWNIKITWISMINPTKCVLFMYCTLLRKKALDAPTIPSAKSNLSLLIGVETLLGLNVVM
jgi:hypothetical protein